MPRWLQHKSDLVHLSPLNRNLQKGYAKTAALSDFRRALTPLGLVSIQRTQHCRRLVNATRLCLGVCDGGSGAAKRRVMPTVRCSKELPAFAMCDQACSSAATSGFCIFEGTHSHSTVSSAPMKFQRFTFKLSQGCSDSGFVV